MTGGMLFSGATMISRESFPGWGMKENIGRNPPRCWQPLSICFGELPIFIRGEELGMTNADYTDISQYRDVESLNYYQILLERGKTKEEALKVLSCRSRDNGRTPMQWDGTENAGFTSGTPWIGCPENYREINVSVQVEDEDSVFHFYRELIALRKRKKVVAEGRIEFLCDDQPEVFAYRRSLKGGRTSGGE